MVVRQAPAAALVPRAPDAFNQALAAGDAAVLVLILVAVARRRRRSLFDVPTGRADGEQGLRPVQDLAEELRRQRERAEILEHI